MGEGTDTSIKVSKAARARLGVLAAERGTTIRSLVEELAAGRLTRAEREARGQAARAHLREHMGVEVTEDDLAAGDRLLPEMEARAARQRGATA
ncbi:hypothetical protein LHJ74_00420 [Streptomyces sp. N2-109]|uniref:Ribbon-helix-helix protein CopG domain-containing protein n=1 Tax=Streptomyces gossypii TaxID=2883101 RepID=A0ABT2JL27_9ACTN|nr:hypothetical protein [Streptomyces gossypii]MCT2588423.1 hypothetical protein [Streptomyces gossypii]